MGVETLVSISNALDVSPITVLRKAGLLPPGPDKDISFEDWKYLLEQLTPDERETDQVYSALTNGQVQTTIASLGKQKEADTAELLRLLDALRAQIS